VVQDPATNDHIEAGGGKSRALDRSGHERGGATVGMQLGPPTGYVEYRRGQVQSSDNRASREEGERQIALTTTEV